jgi:hypothetical protein
MVECMEQIRNSFYRYYTDRSSIQPVIDILATGGYKFNNKHKITASVQYYNSKFNGDRSLYLGENLVLLLQKMEVFWK